MGVVVCLLLGTSGRRQVGCKLMVECEEVEVRPDSVHRCLLAAQSQSYCTSALTCHWRESVCTVVLLYLLRAVTFPQIQMCRPRNQHGLRARDDIIQLQSPRHIHMAATDIGSQTIRTSTTESKRYNPLQEHSRTCPCASLDTIQQLRKISLQYYANNSISILL